MRKAWMVGVIMLALIGFSCEKELKDPDKEIKYTGPLMENKDVITLYSDSAKLLMKLQAPVQQQFENGNIIFPDGLYIEFYDKPGQLTSTLRANYGEQQQNKNFYIVRGNVIMDNLERKQKLETEELFWDRNKDRLYTEKFVTVTTPEKVVMGHGLETNQQFFPYTFHKVTGSFYIEE